jgi:hypothetical protein
MFQALALHGFIRLVAYCFGSKGEKSRSELRSDSRGAILVLGILLGAMLVSVVFHIASVGQAILWRENAQDAADAVAYEAALWNARGMNVIVALNIFLALLIAILMFWRLIMIVVTTMLVLAALACLAMLVPGLQFLEPLCNLAPRLANIVARMVQYDLRYTPKLYRAMSLIHRGQVIVASATPIVSAVKSSTHIMFDDNYPDVDIALGVGMGLVPSLLYPPSPELGDSPGNLPCGVTPSNRKADLSGKIMGKPTSLPVQHWYEIDELCGKGAQMQVTIVAGMLERMAGVLGFEELGWVAKSGPWGEIWGFIAEILSPVLCESLGGSVQERFEEIIDRACKDDKDRKKCEKKMRDESNKNGGSGGKGGKGNVGGVSSDDVLYAKPYWLATNGNLFMQSWGVVRAERKFVDQADKMITFSNRFGGGKDIKDIEKKAWVVAGAEMFFDGKEGWAKTRYQAPWAMNWRARLRRFHDPMEYAGGVIQTAIVESLWGAVDRVLAGGPLGSMIQKLTGGKALGGSFVGRFGGTQIHGFVLSLARQELTERGRSTMYEHAGIQSAASWVTDQMGAGKNDIIH